MVGGPKLLLYPQRYCLAGRSGGELLGSRLSLPRQKLVERLDVVTGDVGEHVGEPGLRVDDLDRDQLR